MPELWSWSIMVSVRPHWWLLGHGHAHTRLRLGPRDWILWMRTSADSSCIHWSFISFIWDTKYKNGISYGYHHVFRPSPKIQNLCITSSHFWQVFADHLLTLSDKVYTCPPGTKTLLCGIPTNSPAKWNSTKSLKEFFSSNFMTHHDTSERSLTHILKTQGEERPGHCDRLWWRRHGANGSREGLLSDLMTDLIDELWHADAMQSETSKSSAE